MTAVHQFIPTFAPRSAVGNHALQVRSVLQEMGLRSDIYVSDAWPELAHLATPFREVTARAGEKTWLLYQASTGSPIAAWLAERPEPKIVNYHNMTPAALFAPWEPHVAAELVAGRHQLADLAPFTELGVAVSEYNRSELEGLGYRATTVAPFLFDADGLGGEIDRSAAKRLRDSAGEGTSWLFVGRIAPNKAQHDLIKAFEWYRRVYDGDARLRLVGGSSSHAYESALLGICDALDLAGAVDFCGDVSDAELGAHYSAADVFVCLSDHEGFGVPLLEAAHHGVPVVAFGAAAVPETLGDGGLLLFDKSPAMVAAAVHRVVSDDVVRNSLVTRGRARLADFSLDRTRARFASVISELVT